MLSSIIRRSFGGAVAVGVLVASAVVAVPKVQAETSNLSGSWRGGGKIVFPSGESERAYCRALFHRRGGESYRMNAVCSTASTRVEQVANIRHVGGNTYRGDFFNEEHGISGSIRIRLRGSRLTASLAGGGGTAAFELNR